ncbi:MAG: hypothetical protein RL757_1190 [Bacteroidota bacterium]
MIKLTFDLNIFVDYFKSIANYFTQIKFSFIEKNIKNIIKSLFTNNWLVQNWRFGLQHLLGASAIVQLLGVLVWLVFARLYDGVSFAHFAIFTTVSSVIAFNAHGRYAMAIVTAETDQKAQQIFALSMSLTGLVSFVFTIFLYFFGNWWNPFLTTSILKIPIFIWIGAYCFLVAANIVLENVLNRNKNFELLSKGRGLRAVVNMLLGCWLGYFGFVEGMIVSLCVAQFFMFIFYSNKIFFLLNFKNVMRISFNEMKNVAIENRDFAIFGISTGVVLSLLENVNIFLIEKYFGYKVLADFAFADRILRIPATVLGAPMGEYFFRNSVENFKIGKYTGGGAFLTTLKNFTRTSVGLTMCWAIPMLFLGEILFGFVFGQKWSGAGAIASLMTLKMGVLFVYTGLGNLTLITEKQAAQFWREIGLQIFILLLFYILIINNLNFKNILLVRFLVEGFFYVLLCRWLIKDSSVSFLAKVDGFLETPNSSKHE